jgi:hypothetical protein
VERLIVLGPTFNVAHHGLYCYSNRCSRLPNGQQHDDDCAKVKEA